MHQPRTGSSTANAPLATPAGTPPVCDSATWAALSACSGIAKLASLVSTINAHRNLHQACHAKAASITGILSARRKGQKLENLSRFAILISLPSLAPSSHLPSSSILLVPSNLAPGDPEDEGINCSQVLRVTFPTYSYPVHTPCSP